MTSAQLDADDQGTPLPGSVVGPVDITAIAHGGAAVGRYQGRVIFVRHALPGEQVLVRLTDVNKASFWRGDVAEVLVASPDRVPPICPIAGICGGCDFQHASAAAQRRLKASVVVEQLQRLAGIDLLDADGLALSLDSLVEPADADHPDQLVGWRTRAKFRVTSNGELAMRPHRSLDLIPLPETGCAIAHPAINSAPVREAAEVATQEIGTQKIGTEKNSTEEIDIDEIDAVVSDDGLTVLVDGALVDGALVDGALVDGVQPSSRSVPLVRQRVNDVDYFVAGNGFWQVHPRSAQVLSDAVIAGLRPRPGERALDLYCGVGLFAGQLAAHGVACLGVEANREAIELARRNVPSAKFFAAPVERSITRWRRPTDLVVLDPPRKGAGASVCRAVAQTRPRAIAYVACDPASLARDVATFGQVGYGLSSVRAFDLFPMTHHVECVAILEPDMGGSAAG